MKIVYTLLALVLLTSCQTKKEEQNTWIEKETTPTAAEQIAQLKADGFEIFDYYDEKLKDTVIMQKYFLAFLNTGPTRDQSEAEAAEIQKGHRAHLGHMYELGFADISGPLEDEDGAMQGITIYNVPTLKMADSLANLDPAVKAGRLMIDIKPLWAGKGFPLR